jgi:hypothetical protein
MSVGHAGSFTVTTSGFPSPALSASGALPAGVTFTDNGNGTASLAGTPAPGSGGAYPLTLTADNGIGGPVTQDLTLTVDGKPSFTSGSTATFAIRQAGSFTVAAAGFPTPALGESGSLPTGLTFSGNANGTATIHGTPKESGSFTLHITATNTIGSATQNLTVLVTQAPKLKVPATLPAKVGKHMKVVFKSAGSPPPAMTVSGALPAGLTYVDHGNGKGTLSGTPAAGSAGKYVLRFSATNSSGQVTKRVVLQVAS